MRKPMILFLFFAAAALGLGLVAWSSYRLLAHPAATDYTGYPRATVAIKGHPVTVVVADTTSRRDQGLSGRPSMPQDEGMLFRFSIPAKYSFWMKEMNFPLDMIWIREGMIVDISKDVPPPPPGASTLTLPTYSPSAAVDTVLEVNAGIAQRYGWQAGDAVQVQQK